MRQSVMLGFLIGLTVYAVIMRTRAAIVPVEILP